MAKKKQANNQRKIIIGAAALLVVVGAGLAYWRHTPQTSLTGSSSASKSKAQTSASTTATINDGPPTAAEKAESDAANKAAIVAQNTPAPTPTNTKVTANPVIVRASQTDPGQALTVSAYVGSVIEDGGTCTLTMTQAGSTTITKTTTGFADATKTDCPQFTVDFSEFSQTGNWLATVSYSSATASGSTSQTVKIQ